VNIRDYILWSTAAEGCAAPLC